MESYYFIICTYLLYFAKISEIYFYILKLIFKLLILYEYLYSPTFLSIIVYHGLSIAGPLPRYQSQWIYRIPLKRAHFGYATKEIIRVSSSSL